MKSFLALILVFFLCANTVLLAQSGVNITPETSRSIRNVVDITLKALQKDLPSNINRYLYPGMSVTLLSPDEQRELTLSFIDGSITEFQYRLKTSGNNIALFLEKNGRILSNYDISNTIYVGNTTGDEDRRLNYYFIKIALLYQNIVNNDDGGRLLIPAEVEIEIQMVQVQNEFKIIGFIV